MTQTQSQLIQNDVTLTTVLDFYFDIYSLVVYLHHRVAP